MMRAILITMICSCLCSAADLIESNRKNQQALQSIHLTSVVHYEGFQTPQPGEYKSAAVERAVVMENKKYDVDEVKIIHFVRDEMLYDSRDLRDLSEAKVRHGLSPQELTILERSRGFVDKGGKTVVWFPRGQDLLKRKWSAVVPSPDRAFYPDRELLYLGVVPEAILKDAAIQGNTATVNEARIFVFNPDFGKHLVSAEFFGADGNLVRKLILSDYRLVDGVWIPFRQEETLGPIVITRTVRAVRVNSVDDEIIRVPPEYSQDRPAPPYPYGSLTTRPSGGTNSTRPEE